MRFVYLDACARIWDLGGGYGAGHPVDVKRRPTTGRELIYEGDHGAVGKSNNNRGVGGATGSRDACGGVSRGVIVPHWNRAAGIAIVLRLRPERRQDLEPSGIARENDRAVKLRNKCIALYNEQFAWANVLGAKLFRAFAWYLGGWGGGGGGGEIFIPPSVTQLCDVGGI